MCDIKGMVDCIHDTKMRELVGEAHSTAIEVQASRELDTDASDTARRFARISPRSPARNAPSSREGGAAVPPALCLSTAGNRVSSIDLSSKQKDSGERQQGDGVDVKRKGERGVRIGEIVELGAGGGEERVEGEDGEGEGKGEAVCQERLRQPYQLQTVAHSLGGAACLIYVVTQRWKKQPQRMTRLICLSPAGASGVQGSGLIAG